MKRRWWIAAAGVSLVAVASVIVVVARSEDRVSQEYFAKIGDGMSEEDVVALLGRPADDVHREEYTYLSLNESGGEALSNRTYPAKTWHGTTAKITVVFTDDGRVFQSDIEEVDNTFLGRTRRWWQEATGTPPDLDLPS